MKQRLPRKLKKKYKKLLKSSCLNSFDSIASVVNGLSDLIAAIGYVEKHIYPQQKLCNIKPKL